MTRGRAVDRDTLARFIESLAIPRAEKDALLDLTPAAYVGAAETLARAHPPAIVETAPPAGS